MTRKDYILIASALQGEYQTYKTLFNQGSLSMGFQMNGAGFAARAIAREMEKTNPKFDVEHFLAVVRGEKDLNSRPSR